MKMDNNLRFGQKWEFRNKNNSFGSSTDDSKLNSIREPVLMQHIPVPGLAPVEDEPSEASKPHFEEEENLSPEKETKIKAKKGRKPRKRLQASTIEVNIMDDLKIFMDSLIDELKVERENLVKQMAEELSKSDAETPSPSKAKRGRRRTNKTSQPRRSKKAPMKTDIPDKEAEQPGRDQTDIAEEGTAFEDGGKPENGSRARVTEDRSAERSAKSIEAFNYGVQEHQAEPQLLALTDNDKEKNPLSTSQLNPLNNSITLGIRAQNCHEAAPDKSVKGKTIEEGGQVNHMGIIRSSQPVPPVFASKISAIVPPSMLGEPTIANFRLDTFPRSYLQRAGVDSDMSLTSVRSNQAIRRNSTNLGYLTDKQRLLGGSVPMGSRTLDAFDQSNNLIFSNESFHQGVNGVMNLTNQMGSRSCQRENSHVLDSLGSSNALLRYSGPEQFLNTIHESISDQRAITTTGRSTLFQTFPIQNMNSNGSLFPKQD